MMRSALAMAVFTFLALAAALPAAAATPAGVAAAVRGKVTLERAGAVGVAVQTGAQIFLGDRIATGAEGGLQVLLLDESVFTLGPNSALVVDRFVYDPKTDEGELKTELVRGAFRFVSGKIAKHDPDKMKVKLPAGTIGVRGTIVGVLIDAATGRSLVWLAGPGANSLGVPTGSISVENAGVVQNVGRSGFGVEIPDSTSPPTPPFSVPEGSFGTLGFEVAPPGAPLEESADATGPATNPLAPPPSGTTDADFLAPLALLPGGGAPPTSLLPIVPEPLGPISNPIPAMDMSGFTSTTNADLNAFSAGFDGHFLFDLQRVPFQSGTGDLRLIVDLDFQNDVVGIQVLSITSSLLGTQGTGAGATSVPFGSAGDARFLGQLSYFESSSSLCINGCPVQFEVGFQNIPTQIAGQLNAQVSVGSTSTILDTTVPQSVPITLIAPGEVTAP